MASVHSLLARVARLEVQRIAPRSRIETAFGSLADFETHVTEAIAAGKLSNDFPIEGIRRWHAEG